MHSEYKNRISTLFLLTILGIQICGALSCSSCRFVYHSNCLFIGKMPINKNVSVMIVILLRELLLSIIFLLAKHIFDILLRKHILFFRHEGYL